MSTMTTTYQSMCADLLLALPEHKKNNGKSRTQQSSGQDTSSPSSSLRGIIHRRNSECPTQHQQRQDQKTRTNEPIPLYFAWSRLDNTSVRNTSNNAASEIDNTSSVEQDTTLRKENHVTTDTLPMPTRNHQQSSHHFLVSPDFVSNEPLTTEYGDKYRSWTERGVQKKSVEKKRRDAKSANSANGRNGTNNHFSSGDGVALALHGTTLGGVSTPGRNVPVLSDRRPAPTPTTPNLRHTAMQAVVDCRDIAAKAEKKPCAPSSSSRTAETLGSKKTAKQFCTTTRADLMANKNFVDDKENVLVYDNNASTSAAGEPQTSTPQPKSLAAENDGLCLIASGNATGTAPPKLQTRSDNKQHEKSRRDSPFWKSSQGSTFGIYTLSSASRQPPNRRGRARRFGEKVPPINARNRKANRSSAGNSSSASDSGCIQTKQKQTKMRNTTRRALQSSSTKLFPRLPGDPLSYSVYNRKV
mmetsp:Transcript_10142/g.21899  ORF Transcript_10142/g.21899 Transcript_10142/m.21899 type:complete len:471 (+) Transcript_10142:305-1717(+)